MEEIKQLYEDVKDIEDVVKDLTNTKAELRNLQNDISKTEKSINEEMTSKIQEDLIVLEDRRCKILQEIKKIDLFAKDVYSLTEIEAMFEFVNDKKVLCEKCLLFVSSSIYSLYVNRETFVRFFNPCRFLDYKYKDGNYKVIKFSKELNDFFGMVKDEILQKCYAVFSKIMAEELECASVTDIVLFYDKSYFYIVFWSDYTENICDDEFFASIDFLQTECLVNQKHIIDVFFEIFKNNLCKKLLANNLQDCDLEKTNMFLEHSEFYITNITEWKLDCVMKHIIDLSRTSKSGEYISTKYDKIKSLMTKIDSKYMPENISREFYEFLLCLNVFNSLKSQRAEKASKIIEKTLYKLIDHENTFVQFADASVAVRLFPDMPIISKLIDKREKLHDEIIKKNAELTMSLQSTPLALKVYFKEKHYDFTNQVNQFVPCNNRMLFQMDFFDTLYNNVIRAVLCINYMDNDVIRNVSDMLKYLIDMPHNSIKENITSYNKMQSYYQIFTKEYREVVDLYKTTRLNVDKTEFNRLCDLVFPNRR